MRTALVSFALAVLAAAAASAQTTIDFDPRPPGFRVDIAGYTEGGMVFADIRNPGSAIVADSGGIPSNGTAFLANCGFCGPSFEAQDGSAFDLLAVDLGEFLFFGSGPFPATLTITGLREDGSTAVASLTTDGVPGFQTFELGDAFSDLVSVDLAPTNLFMSVAVDNLVVRAGLDKPNLEISPPSGTYVTTQAFDLTLVALGTNAVVLAAATLDGEDFTAFLAGCTIAGSLDTVPGVTLRCPLGAGFFDEGVHEIDVTVEFGDGSTDAASATWEVLGNTEP